ncbi:MAG: HEPN domain-containing protein [Armatimonadota bacterium]|nr:HEPN domain-containing protein [Armatimonadota bacterium]
MTGPDEAQFDELAEWLRRASEDLDCARVLLEMTEHYENIAFLAQQAGEKYLKAYLFYHGVSFPATHDITHLINLVATVDQDLADAADDARALSRYSVAARYPTPDLTVSCEDAARLVGIAGAVRSLVLEALPDCGSADA